MSKHTNWRWGVLLLAAAGLAGCESQLRLSPDYGVATRQNIAAQIGDPDARYSGVPQPGADANRAALAQQRYVTDKVTPPASTSTSNVSIGNGQ